MASPVPQHPCPWCQGRDFVVIERVFLEITDYGRAFTTVTCKTCGHTAFFTEDTKGLVGKAVQVKGTADPYR
jgi:predicted nucleic-acid-binding Zn-ribbon protein